MGYFGTTSPTVTSGFASGMQGNIKYHGSMKDALERDKNRPPTVKFPIVGQGYECRAVGMIPTTADIESPYTEEKQKAAIQKAYKEMVANGKLGYGIYGDGITYININNRQIMVLGVGSNYFPLAKEAVDSVAFIRLRDQSGKIQKVFTILMIKPNGETAVPGGFRNMVHLWDPKTNRNVERIATIAETSNAEMEQETGVHAHTASNYNLEDLNLREWKGTATLGYVNAERKIQLPFQAKVLDSILTSHEDTTNKGEVIPGAIKTNPAGEQVHIKRVHVTTPVLITMDAILKKNQKNVDANTFLRFLFPHGDENEKNDSIGVRVVDVTKTYLNGDSYFEEDMKTQRFFFAHHKGIIKEAITELRKTDMVSSAFLEIR